MAVGVSPQETRDALRAFETVMPVRAIQPRDGITVLLDRAGNLQGMELQRFPQRKIVVERRQGGFEARRVFLPVDTYVRRVDGSVESTLYGAIHEAGGDDALLVEFANLFAWDFDFSTDTRQGDRFSMLVKERWVGGHRLGGGVVLYGEYTPVQGKTMAAYLYDDGEDVAGYYDASGKSVKKRFLKSPLNFTRISSHFSYNRMHPILKRPRPHLGVDYAAPTGTPVVAIGAGKVVFAGWIRGFGKTVKIRHADGYLSQYAHLSKIRVKQGVRVAQNDLIGNVGSTGLSTGPHLDYRVQQNGKWINPLRLKGGTSAPLPASHRDRYFASVQELEALHQSLSSGEALAWSREEGQGPAGAVAE